MQEKNNASFVLGIISIIVAFIFPLIKYYFWCFWFGLGYFKSKESGLDYTTEIMLSIVGIVLSVIFCLVFISQLSGLIKKKRVGQKSVIR